MIRYNKVLSNVRNTGSWFRGLLLIKDMQQAALELNVASFNALVRLAAIPDGWLLGCQLLAAMLLGQVEADVITCNTAISSCEGASYWLRALSFLKMYQQDSVKARGQS